MVVKIMWVRHPGEQDPARRFLSEDTETALTPKNRAWGGDGQMEWRSRRVAGGSWAGKKCRSWASSESRKPRSAKDGGGRADLWRKVPGACTDPGRGKEKSVVRDITQPHPIYRKSLQWRPGRQNALTVGLPCSHQFQWLGSSVHACIETHVIKEFLLVSSTAFALISTSLLKIVGLGVFAYSNMCSGQKTSHLKDIICPPLKGKRNRKQERANSG